MDSDKMSRFSATDKADSIQRRLDRLACKVDAGMRERLVKRARFTQNRRSKAFKQAFIADGCQSLFGSSCAHQAFLSRFGLQLHRPAILHPRTSVALRP